MKIIFMGTPDFAKESLEAVYNSGHDILGVVTNPDRPKGRGMKMIASPVKEFAISKDLEIYQPEKVKNNVGFIEKMKSLEPDVICVVAYGKILPKEILDIPRLGCINVHGSLLPKYRGAAPIQWSILNGDKKTGITTMYMDIGMDTGDMILREEVEIGPDETTGELIVTKTLSLGSSEIRFYDDVAVTVSYTGGKVKFQTSVQVSAWDIKVYNSYGVDCSVPESSIEKLDNSAQVELVSTWPSGTYNVSISFEYNGVIYSDSVLVTK